MFSKLDREIELHLSRKRDSIAPDLFIIEVISRLLSIIEHLAIFALHDVSELINKNAVSIGTTHGVVITVNYLFIYVSLWKM